MLELRAEDVKVSFGDHQVLKGVSAAFQEGTLNSLIGINGAGKSVFLKSIAGLQPFHGSIRLSDKTKETKEFTSRDISYVPQMAYSTSALTAVEMVLLGKVRSLHWKVEPSVVQEVEHIMERLSISHLASQRFSELSGGQKQMVVMAQAFLSRPRVLLLDEPTSALDLYHQLELLELTKEYIQENHMIALVVMHDLSLVARYSDSILLLHEGKAILQGNAEEVLRKEVIEDVYRVEIDVEKTSSGYMAVMPIRTKC